MTAAVVVAGERRAVRASIGYVPQATSVAATRAIL